MITKDQYAQALKSQQEIEQAAERAIAIWEELDPCCKDRHTYTEFTSFDEQGVRFSRIFSISGREDVDPFLIPKETLFLSEDEQREAIRQQIEEERQREEQARQAEDERHRQERIKEARRTLESEGEL